MGFLRSRFFHVVLILGLAFCIFRFGIRPPAPASVIRLYMTVVLLATLIYVSADSDSWRNFVRPIRSTLMDPSRRTLRYALMVVVPLLLGYYAYTQAAARPQAPPELRAVHPAPPDTVQFRGKPINISGAENPLRKDQANFKKHVAAGGEIYIRNCMYCHGDNLDGQGHFAKGFNPPPANFQDPGTIAMLQEAYLFWRVAKGGPGLPKESTPWNSVMLAFLALVLMLSPSLVYAQAGDVNAGKVVYERKCLLCHGEKGDGKGPAAELLDPKPRDFTSGIYKIRTTAGKAPSDQDLYRVISDGMPGTSMPSWAVLPEKDRWNVIAYVKSFAADKFKEAPKKQELPKDVASSADSIKRGKEMFEAIECNKCHGADGRADGPSRAELKDEWGHPIAPANLTKRWNFRGGASRTDIAMRLGAGVLGTPMPTFIDSVEKPEDIWHLTNYILSLSPDSPHYATLVTVT